MALDILFNDYNGHHSPTFKIVMWTLTIMCYTLWWVVENPIFKALSGILGIVLAIMGIISYYYKIKVDRATLKNVKNKKNDKV